MVPKLFYERLDDFGVDFCLPNQQRRRADPSRRLACRQSDGRRNADGRRNVRALRDRIAPAAVVPVYTPEEAIEEATYALKNLGFKVIMISNHVRRPIPALARAVSDLRRRRLTKR